MNIIADTSATSHFCTTEFPVINSIPATKPVNILTPNGAIITSTHVAELNLPSLPPSARTVHVVPELSGTSLLSVGQLCDAGCDVKFSQTGATITHNDNIVLTGTRTSETRLWHIDDQ
jgi:hypothetical protein